MTTGWSADGDKFPVRTVAIYRIRYFVCCDLYIRFPYKYIKGVVAKLGVWVDRTRGVNRIKDGELHSLDSLNINECAQQPVVWFLRNTIKNTAE